MHAATSTPAPSPSPAMPYGARASVCVLNMASRVVGLVPDTDCLIGLGTLDERTLFLVDIDKLMSSAETALANSAAF